jgi:thiamine pyrophosphokinase
VFTGGEGPKPEIIKGIIPQGKPCIRRLQRLSATSRGVLNLFHPHSLNHVRASTVTLSLRSSIRRIMGDPLASGALIVAADSGLALAETAEFKPDWIIGDMDSLNNDRLNCYSIERIIRYPADKDNTDTELALALLREKGCGETWIIGGGGGRTDHFFGIRELFEGDAFPSRWLTPAEDIYCIEGPCGKTGGPGGKLAMSLAPESVVSVFLTGCGPWKAESTGLKWSLDNVRWKRGMTGLSNIATEEKIGISSKQGRFMVILEDIWQQ